VLVEIPNPMEAPNSKLKKELLSSFGLCHSFVIRHSCFVIHGR
jgi:hypothetical protein